jgi:hypothetical protein
LEGVEVKEDTRAKTLRRQEKKQEKILAFWREFRKLGEKVRMIEFLALKRQV